ncbi:MAG: FAD:protein FMN transferase [Patescibacteria group bacterium]
MMSATTFEFEAIGTTWQIDITDVLDKGRRDGILKKIKDRIDIFDMNYSRFRADSLVTKMSQMVGAYELPEDAKLMINIYQRLYKLTGGSLTPLIGKVMEDAGYDPDYSLKTKTTLTQPPSWNEAVDYDFPYMYIKQPIMLDFGAAGKGYLIDIVAGILSDDGIERFTIDAGGDIFHRGDKRVSIGLENPSDVTEVIGIASILNQSICGSAGNRRTWGDFHHIIDPYTLKSPRHLLATWVVADTALVGDALATALFFVSAEVLKAEYNFEYLVLNADHSIEKSEYFPAELFIKE